MGCNDGSGDLRSRYGRTHLAEAIRFPFWIGVQAGNGDFIATEHHRHDKASQHSEASRIQCCKHKHQIFFRDRQDHREETQDLLEELEWQGQ